MNTHGLLSGQYPMVSVGVPTYNGGKKILAAITSVLTQHYPNIEIIISDNCSSDDTSAVCFALAQENSSVRYFKQHQNIGLMPNFEFVRDQARGDYFMWLSDDDALEPRILPKYVDFLVKHPDYALVSGQIKHWIGNRPVFCERNFNMEQNLAMLRMLNFYFKVVYGSIFYGLMKMELARQIPLTDRIGDDWHFVASIAYLGKIKNLDCIGYHKRCGGVSKNFQQYAKAIGASSFSARFPHVQIAMDAFSNILYYSPVYTQQHYFKKMVLGLSSFLGILVGFYGKRYPFILGGKIKRWMGFVNATADAETGANL
jgi:glycosyltransferase involved in cell wall biosynthesis